MTNLVRNRRNEPTPPEIIWAMRFLMFSASIAVGFLLESWQAALITYLFILSFDPTLNNL